MSMLPGIQLRTAREKRGLTLLDVAHETRIPAQRLRWLEQDNWAAFGSLTYARSFLKIYGQFLDIDVEEVLEELPTSKLGGPGDYRYLTENHGPWVVKDRRLQRLLNAQERKKASRSPLVAGLVIFALVFVGTGLWGHHVSQEALKAGAKQAPTVPLAHETPQMEILSMKGTSRSDLTSDSMRTRPVISQPAPAFDTGLPAGLQ
ncbi:helix-turn-helix domain-containing protein [Prosthecobacter dejongeii]|uniref:Cytoskeletal protein RodZ n=1 Tax=Prosthecobacter dejongeii TaxID=48465 RepID=A0A7W7YPD1_9BACT|nr:helix-turn-helix domain-containing protein [Prosthecobacter dejongeii]MBB5039895.1 cytoskeletal protein RodZ [Prosthecobacter dejongeii]